MKNFVVITAKGGNQSLNNKNIIPINGKPSLYWPLNSAQKSKMIDHVYISTEDKKIKNNGLKYNAKIIDRPKKLSQPMTNHGDVIKHAVEFLELNYKNINTITILLGNSVMINSTDINNNIKMLNKNKELDSCMTVWKAQDDHPLRAMIINDDGYLESYKKVKKIDTNRQSYKDVFYYDQGPWTFKYNSFKKALKYKNGPGPWWWMGKNCHPIIRPWVTGKDTHSKLDLDISKWWLNKFYND